MECTGRIQNIAKDWNSGRFLITFEVNEKTVANEMQSLNSCDKLSIIAKPWKKKRSLDANALLWAVLTEIADVVNSSKDEVYEDMLQKYGVLYKDEEGYITTTLRTNVDISKLPGHWKFYKSDGQFSAYLMIKGTSEYDTAEMAKFLDRVIEEAVELGIAPPTSKEMQRALENWERQHNAINNSA